MPTHPTNSHKHISQTCSPIFLFELDVGRLNPVPCIRACALPVLPADRGARVAAARRIPHGLAKRAVSARPGWTKFAERPLVRLILRRWGGGCCGGLAQWSSVVGVRLHVSVATPEVSLAFRCSWRCGDRTNMLRGSRKLGADRWPRVGQTVEFDYKSGLAQASLPTLFRNIR